MTWSIITKVSLISNQILETYFSLINFHTEMDWLYNLLVCILELPLWLSHWKKCIHSNIDKHLSHGSSEYDFWFDDYQKVGLSENVLWSC